MHNNGGDVEAALMWYFDNVDNPALQLPLKVKKVSGGFQANPESVMMIEQMGFTPKQAKRALRKCDGNLERACDFIFNHMEEADSDDEMQVDEVSHHAAANPFECA